MNKLLVFFLYLFLVYGWEMGTFEILSRTNLKKGTLDEENKFEDGD